MRVFFHVDYKPKATDGRKVGKDDMTTLSAQLDVMSGRIKDISREIEHARKQEISMKEAGGKLLALFLFFSFFHLLSSLQQSSQLGVCSGSAFCRS